MTIIAAVDGEISPSPVVDIGNELASQIGDQLVIVHIMPQSVFEQRRDEAATTQFSVPYLSPEIDMWMKGNQRGGSDVSTEEYSIDEHAEGEASDIARAVTLTTLGEDAEAEYRGRVGDPVNEILREADRLDARYIVIGGRKRTPVGKAVFGSITQSILLDSERPVMAVPDVEDAGNREGPIIASIDGSPHSSVIIQAAIELSRTTRRELDVVHVYEDGNAKNDVLGIVDEFDKSSNEEINAISLSGDPAEQILSHASERRASFIVTGGRRRSPIGKVLFGSVTQSIILNADCPVLAVMQED